MSTVKVRSARAADEAAMVAMAKEEMGAQERADPRFRLRADAMGRYALYLRERMREIDAAVFVAEEGDRVVGVAVGSIRVQDTFFETRRYGYVSDLMVLPEVRRRGIGSALWARVALWFRSLGIDVVRLHVSTRSPEARAFWRAAGAEDFLAEAWIDLPAATEPAARRGGTEREEEETAPASRAATPAASRETLRGERLAEDPDVI